MQHFQQLLIDYGYWVLFIGTFLEGETILIMAGFLAFQGYLQITGVVVTAFVGSFLGDQFYFYLGRLKGRALLKRFHGIARKFRQALKMIEKYGVLVAFVSRFTYGFRIVLPIILGITSLAPRTFFLINLSSALLWSVIFSLAGFLFGKSAALFLDDVGKYEHYLIFLLMGLMMSAWLIHFFHAWNMKKPARMRLARMREFHTTHLDRS